MTTRRPQSLIALSLSLILTLCIFSGVSSLAAPDHANPLLVQASGQQVRG